MFGSRLAAREGTTPALLRLLVVLLAAVPLVVSSSSKAEAFAPVIPLAPALVPTGVAFATTAGVGAHTFFGATTGVSTATLATGAGASAAGVALAPVALAAGAALITGAALYFGWKWANGSSNAGTSLDPAPGASEFQAGWTYGAKHGVSPGVSNVIGPYVCGAVTCVTFTTTGTTHRSFSWCQSVSTWAAGCSLASGAGFDSSTGTRTLTISQPIAKMNRVVLCFGTNACASVMTGAVTDAPNLVGSWYRANISVVPSGSTVVTTRPTSTCSGGGTVVGEAITYTGATNPSSLPPIIAPACPAGETRTGWSTPSTFPGGGTAPAPFAPWAPASVPAAYPLCDPPGACLLTLTQTSPDGSVLNCTTSDVCAGYSVDLSPEMVTTRTDEPQTQLQTKPDGTVVRVLAPTRPDGSTMLCQWGTYTLPIGQCAVIPTERTNALGPPEVDVEDFCNFTIRKPWTWPLTALKCAFIPRQSVLEGHLTPLQDAWGLSPPGMVLDAGGDLITPLVDLGSAGTGPCEGPLLDLPLPTGTDSGDGRFAIRPLSTCSDLAQLVMGYAQPLLSAFIYFGGFFAGAKILLRTLNLESPVEA